jgi:hypothetical protein
VKRPDHTLQAGRPSPFSASTTIYSAVCIAIKYRDTPSFQQLMADFGMSRATAYRCVSAFKAARGELA